MGGLAKRRRPVSTAATTVTPLRDEAFLDTTNILSKDAGVSYGVNRPTKSGSIWPSLATTAVDYGVGYVSPCVVGGQTRAYCTVFDSSATTVHLASPTITDATTVSRPSLGLISHGGNTNNNLCSPAGLTRNQYRVIYDPVALPATPFVCMSYESVASVLSIVLYVSADGRNWGSSVKTISDPAGTGYCEPTSLWRRPDGRWVIYYQDVQTGTADYGSIRRHLGMLLGPSDGSLTGTWTNSGRVLTASGGDQQLYHAAAWRDGELVYAPIGIFDGSGSPPAIGTFSGTVNRINRAALYVGRASSGSTLTLADDTWISTTGVYGEWDGGEIIASNGAARVGNTLHFYPGGDGNTHHQSPESIRNMGEASIGYGRIGQISGTGDVILTTVTATAGARVSVNTTGGVTAAILDGASSPIAGFTAADCETIPSAYDHTIKWAGVSRTPATFRLKLTLSAGTVYHVTIREA